MEIREYKVGPIEAEGAFTSDITLARAVTPEMLATRLEADRVEMDSRPGMRQKDTPFRVDPATGSPLTGGRYLFDTYENAEAYKEWTEGELVFEGVKFWERPIFVNTVRYAWRVVGAHDFKDIGTAHHVGRFERWRLADGRPGKLLERAWPALRDRAEEEGLSSAWLLHNEERRVVGLFTVAEQVESDDPSASASASLAALEATQSLGGALEAQGGAKKVFDRTSLLLNIWLPLSGRAGGAPRISPFSPPLPLPAGREAPSEEAPVGATR